MGLSDREYYRDEQPTGFQLGGAHMLVTKLVALNVILFLVDALFFRGSHALMRGMSVTPETLVKPWLWWQFLTYGFAHSPDNIGHIFGNMLGLWMFGRDVEQVYGPREFLRFYLTAILLGSLTWATRYFFFVDDGAAHYLLGASGGVTAVVLLFVLHFPRRTILLMFFLPVPAWVLGVLLIFYNVLGVHQGGTTAYDVHLVGAAFAFLYFRLHWNLGRLVPSRLRDVLRGWTKSRPKLRIHEPDIEEPYQDLDAEADVVLQKLHSKGEESLSPKERRILEAYSRRMRQKHR
jgi:membrane associated rhomboid family serine protease